MDRRGDGAVMAALATLALLFVVACGLPIAAHAQAQPAPRLSPEQYERAVEQAVDVCVQQVRRELPPGNVPLRSRFDALAIFHGTDPIGAPYRLWSVKMHYGGGGVPIEVDFTFRRCMKALGFELGLAP